MKPLVLYSTLWDKAYTRELQNAAGDRIDFCTYDNIPNFDAKVVFMRGIKSRMEEIPDTAARKIAATEEEFRSRGAAIINSFTARKDFTKDKYFKTLLDNGVTIPFYIPDATLDLTRDALNMARIGFPFICRGSNSTTNAEMWIVKDEDEFQWSFANKQVNMVMQFIDTKDGDYYTKWRAVVVGDKVDNWSCSINKNWIINNSIKPEFAIYDCVRANKKENWPEHMNEQVIKVGKLLDLKIFAVDVVSSYVVDINPSYRFSFKSHQYPLNVGAIREGHFKRVADYLLSL